MVLSREPSKLPKIVAIRGLPAGQAMLSGRVEELTEGVWSVELVGDCYLDYHTSIRIVALACPGVDYIRL